MKALREMRSLESALAYHDDPELPESAPRMTAEEARKAEDRYWMLRDMVEEKD